MTALFPDFMDKASLTRIAQGDVGALRASVTALDARIASQLTEGAKLAREEPEPKAKVTFPSEATIVIP